MKKLILSLSLLFIPCTILFSQNILHQKLSEQDDYWNMAFTGGVLFNLIDNIDKDNKFRTGYIGGFDLSYDMKGRKSAIVITANYGRLKYTYSSPEFNSYKEYFEVTFGPRFYLGKGYFVETLLGNYIINYTSARPDPVGLEYQSGFFGKGLYACFGAGACAGKRLKLTDDFDAILKGRICYLFPELKSVLSVGLTSGIVFLNKKIEPEIKKRYSKNGTWSVTITGGLNNPELFHSDEYSISGNAGAEVAYRSAPKFEVYGNLEYNEIKRNPDYYSDGGSLTDLTFGPRFLFGNEKYLSTFELGLGLYFQDRTDVYYNNDAEPFMGINFGAGLIINVTEHFGFPVRGKMHLVFNRNSKLGEFLTLTGGLRYML